MNSRERFVRAVEFGEPDRPPVMHWTLPGAYRVHGSRLEELYARYPSDVLLSPVSHGIFALLHRRVGTAGTTRQDEWGTVWQYTTGDHEGLPITLPLADYRALEGYSFPDPLMGRDEISELLVECVRADDHQHYVFGYVGNLWQQLHRIRGFENCNLDLADGREEFQYLLQEMEKFLLARIQFWGEFEEVDGMHIGDDWGTQTQMMIRPSMWRQVFKPIYRRLVEAIHAGGKHAHYHTDGHTREIVPDLIEIGFDTLNLQVWCMDTEELGQAFAGQVCFRGEMDRQHVLPNGTPDEMTAHVRSAVKFFNTPKGGYIHYGSVGPDVPLANVEAMLSTFYEVGGD